MGAADLIITNANIHTMDGALPLAEAIAVKDGRALAVGKESDVVNVANGTTRRMNAGGDTHIHLQDSGIGFSTSVDLAGVNTIEELQNRVRDEAQRRHNEFWIQGLCWDPSIYMDLGLDRHAIDAAVADRPVYLMASDGHNAVLNTRALQELGVKADTADPSNGEIVRDEDGEPTGMLYEDAIWWAYSKLPKLSDEGKREGTKFGATHANKHGITGVLDAMAGEGSMRIYTDLDKRGELTLRVAATSKVFPRDTLDEAMERLKHIRATYRTDKAYMHSAKFFLDGVMENGTAAMLEPMVDGVNAPIMFDEEWLRETLIAFDRERFQLHLHTIGDKAVRVALDGIEAARNANGVWPALHQLAHIQSIHPDDIPRFRDLGAVANWQPLWACPEGSADMSLGMLGPERGRYMYAVGSVVRTGAPYAISSDWFVSTLNPFEIMQVAVTRQNPAHGRDSPALCAEECIDVESVVRGYTVNAAQGAWRGDTTGTLSVGKYADLIIVDRDVFGISPYEIGETNVLLTMLEGIEVHCSDQFDA